MRNITISVKNLVSGIFLLAAGLGSICAITGCGAGGFSGYTNDWVYPDDLDTVYVEMFDSRSFRRNHEFDLTDAICKRIEAQTPYKIVSDRDIADSVLSGEITNIGRSVLTYERNTGRTFEHEARVNVNVTWQNLKNNTMLLDNELVSGAVSYSEFLDQDFEYGARVAVNRAAQNIVERMQISY